MVRLSSFFTVARLLFYDMPLETIMTDDWRGIPEEYRNKVVCCNAFTTLPKIPDESIDLLIGDPIYWEYDHYDLITRAAMRVLRPGGSLILQAGNVHRYQAERAMDIAGDDRLMICPQINEIMTGGSQQYFLTKAVLMDKPYIWRMKKGADSKGWMPTLVRGTGKDKKLHEWGDTPAVFRVAIHRLTDPGDIVLDPFSGSGTIAVVCKEYARNFVAFEINPEYVEVANKRLSETQTPLIVPEAEKQIPFEWR
jgi:DNA modification methylase